MFKKLDLYIIKKYLGTFFFSIVLIISISVVFDVTEKIDEFHDNHAPLKAIVFDYYLNFIPYFANLFTPLFSFISVIFFTSKMAYNSEIVAILAGGVSFNRLLRPYIFSAVVIGLMSFLLGAYVIPPANEIRLAFEDKYINKFTSEVARNVQMEVKPGVILYIERFEEKRNRGTHFSLEHYEGKHLVSRTTAKTVTWLKDSLWVVQDYLTRDFDGLYETITKGSRMDTFINVEPYEFFIESQHAPQMTIGELNRYLNKQKERGLGNTQAFADEYYKRISNPFAALILMLIGVSLSSRKVKGGMGLHIGIGIALSAVYILFTTISSVFAVKGSMPTLLAVWLPNIVFSIIGIALYMHAPK
ncbi:MAG: LptF/LptG family permease [bacterium]|uniref:LptF/LptG family permease n=1 Tax=Candidatus Aphodosoma intestinipullorum TaxID=2840674 RepID=A0A940DJM3_9BACT|nr:LptF/LptG family permease [Candidatus Aphodosoma intestinipullorum]